MHGRKNIKLWLKYVIYLFSVHLNADADCVQPKSSPLINKLQVVINRNVNSTSRKHTKYLEKTCISWLCSKCSSSAPRYGTNPNSRHGGKFLPSTFHTPL